MIVKSPLKFQKNLCPPLLREFIVMNHELVLLSEVIKISKCTSLLGIHRINGNGSGNINCIGFGLAPIGILLLFKQ